MSELPRGDITVKDLFLELQGLRGDLTRVLTHMERVDTRNEAADRAHTDYEIRLRALETFRYKLAGISVVGGVGAGWVGYLLGHFVH